MSEAVAPLAPSAEPQHTSDREAASFIFWTTFFLASIWVLLIGAMAGWIHPAFLVLCPWLYIRFELYAHELLHCRSGKQLNLILRRMMVAQAPVHMDYDAYRLYHLDHHRYLGTRDDPEHYLVSSSTWGALFKALFCIEVGTFRHLRLHRQSFTWKSWLTMAMQFGVFVALLVWNWQIFLIYFAVMRIGIGVADFYFHHCLHNADHGAAQWFRRANQRYPWLFGTILGYDTIAILLWHDEHHDSPRVAARCLSDLAPQAATAAPAPHFAAPTAPRQPARSSHAVNDPPA